MYAPLPPASEQDRVAALRELLVMDSDPEPVFDAIAKLASDVCGAPIALVSLLDEERQWFKANVGLTGVTQTPRNIAFCDHAIRNDAVFQVTDARKDARFANNPLVTGEPNIRFYAGAPLVLEHGERVGTLCVVDHAPRELDETQLNTLRSLASVVSATLLMRRDLIRTAFSARTQYERALLDSESHYRAIVESQVEIISLARPDGELRYVNPSYGRQFGFSASEMVGKSLFDFVQLADREKMRASLAEVVRTGNTLSSENRMHSAEGGVRWVAWTHGLQHDAMGKALLHSVGRDITAQKQAEEALRASQSLLNRTGRAAQVGGWEIDLASGTVTWSDETRRIHEVGPEYRPEIGTGLSFYAPEARPLIQQAVQDGMDRGEPWDLELPFITALSRRIWVRTIGEVEFEAGKAVRLTGAFQDVTQRKLLEQRLASHPDILRSVTESIPATVAVVDLEGRYQMVNSAFERQCGLTREQIVGRTARELMGEREYERRWPWIQRSFAGEAVAFELDHPGEDGTTYMSLNYAPLRLATGEVDGFVVVTQDVTAQKREALRLIAMTQRDALTGLMNRTGFENYLQRNLDEGGGASLALLYIDLDHFKPVNDQHGHAAGDKILQLFGQRLLALVRPTDAVARLGGDEFAIALSGAREQANANAVADKVLAVARAPFNVGGVRIEIGASVGVAFRADPTSGWADLVGRADAKLLFAKASGKGRLAHEPH